MLSIIFAAAYSMTKIFTLPSEKRGGKEVYVVYYLLYTRGFHERGYGKIHVN